MSSSRRRALGCTVPLAALRGEADLGVGTFGDLVAFGELVARAGCSKVQILPVHALARGETSPYGALGAFALDPIYLDLARVPEVDDALVQAALGADGLREARARAAGPRVDFAAVRQVKERVLARAFERFVAEHDGRKTARGAALDAFVAREASWLEPWTTYAALRERANDHGWETFGDDLLALAHDPSRDPAFARLRREHAYRQLLCFEQWDAARAGLARLGVSLVGDLPFIVARESADVFAHRREFRLDVSLGAPPDGFAPEGQDWGLPAYDWDRMDESGLAWLRRRFRHAARLYDAFRIDHVVGFFRQWVRRPGERGWFEPWAEDAQRARGAKVLDLVLEEAGPGRVLAEDLGVIPPFVREAMGARGLPGYRVLPWESDGPHLRDPRAFPPASCAVWSTHDTAPLRGWWGELDGRVRARFAEMAGTTDGPVEGARELALLDLVLAAGSDLVLLQAQELLGLAERVNVPGVVGPGNWTMRLPASSAALLDDAGVGERLAAIRARAVARGRAD